MGIRRTGGGGRGEGGGEEGGGGGGGGGEGGGEGGEGEEEKNRREVPYEEAVNSCTSWLHIGVVIHSKERESAGAGIPAKVLLPKCL